MAEYIEREYAVDAVADVYYDTPDINLSCEKFEAAILEIPAADVAPVRHGRWCVDGVYVGCSVCNRFTLSPIVERLPTFKYCPFCGAKMDEEVSE